ncbi:cytochrome c biogenesis CcdA family protein [Tumebacillus permanentifrigoris]|uniref:Cytochrome c biogenesis protein CcdA n=1 Tax=Tumebacillus permanentifrigoris TaxID=378543 RepID=A0A316D5V2_9BACL|nr:cytochrome c biogenesis protein CcdA [Tumebacillus permanentifrigoris]PWK07455.1 cytochrome c biogenesis protein CcdA [Tumebacillus permanentifrigoris]
MLSSSNPTFIIAFLAGLLSFVSPCVLPLYPSYLSYITGVTYDQMYGAERDTRTLRKKALTHSLFFVLGFSIIFVTLGFTSGTIGTIFMDYQVLIRQVGGILIIVMGLFMSGLIKIDFLMQTKKFQTRNKPVGYLGAIVVGISFAAGWTPCVGPILASVLAIAATNPVSGGSLMLFYSLGFALPFIFLAYTLGSVRWLLKYSELITKIGGFGMVLMGILLITNGMTLITQWLLRLSGGFIGF